MRRLGCPRRDGSIHGLNHGVGMDQGGQRRDGVRNVWQRGGRGLLRMMVLGFAAFVGNCGDVCAQTAMVRNEDEQVLAI